MHPDRCICLHRMMTLGGQRRQSKMDSVSWRAWSACSPASLTSTTRSSPPCASSSPGGQWPSTPSFAIAVVALASLDAVLTRVHLVSLIVRSIDSLFVLSVNCSIRSAVVVERVKVLLEGHPGLLRHFNQFLPWGYIRAHGPVGRISVWCSQGREARVAT